MTPVLFDTRDLFKAGISLVLLFLLIFAGGFISGYQKGVHIEDIKTTESMLSLPVNVIVSATALAPQPPVKIDAGVDIDVDEPDPVSTTVQLDFKPEPVTDSAVEMLPVSPLHNRPIVLKKPKEPVSTTQFVRIASATSIPTVTSSKSKMKIVSVIKSTAAKNSNSIKSVITQPNVMTGAAAGTRQNARYSIQTGVYRHQLNAKNQLKSLEKLGFDAYLADFLNKKQQRRYNVRLGYYANKKLALRALKRYHHMQGEAGYLVKLRPIFHAENDQTARNQIIPNRIINKQQDYRRDAYR